APRAGDCGTQNNGSYLIRGVIRKGHIHHQHAQNSPSKSKVGVDLEWCVQAAVHAEPVPDKIALNGVSELGVCVLCVVESSPTCGSPDLCPAGIGVACRTVAARSE